MSEPTATPGSAVTPPTAADVPAWRLVSTLGGGGALAGLLLVFVFQATQPTIQAHKAKVLAEAVEEVLHGPARYDTLYVVDGRLVEQPPAGAATSAQECVYRGYDGQDRLIGYAIPAAQPGFQDVVRLIFGYDPRTDRILGMKVLDSKETPGLGDKIEKDPAFRDQFTGKVTPLSGIKGGGGVADPHGIDMITGATISSRAVIRIINDAVDRLGPALHDPPQGPR